ncbi:MAG: putative tripeptidylaminopeptidase [Marmoricola sp.]|nr:putative tripeptidylaminopeptidase [Marmoricola sp.]
MRKSLTLLTSGLLALGLAPGLTQAAQAQTSAAAPAPAKRHHAPAASAYTPPPLTWGPCASATLTRFGAECATLVVPRDYADPGGAKIGLAVSRVKHKTATSQGVMLTNPGGPGGSGLILSVYQGFVPNDAGLSYDWIGFDPRGVGASTPALSCDPTWAKGDRPPYRPTTAAIHQAWVDRSKAYAEACTRAPGQELFNHVKTTDSVQDMESLRIALGEKKINFYGFSYGTYLGQVYATLHPDRVRRFVWDGTVDPQRVFYKSNQDQDVAFQKTFDIYFRWLAKYSSVYHVGSTYAEVRNTFLATQAKLDRQAEGGVLGGDELLDVFSSAAYYVYDWEDIAQAYSSYLNDGDATGLIARYSDANPTTPGADNGYAMYLGTQCTDAPWPRDQRKLDRDNWRLDRTASYYTWGNAWFNGPCAYWQYPASRPVKVSGHQVRTPILMIGETYDAATPFAGSLVVRRLFKGARLIEGKDGSTHAGSLSGVSCTDDTIAAYLADGTVPARRPGNRADKVCPPVPQPDPTASSARRSAAPQAKAGLPAELRTALAQAQQVQR